MKAEINEEIKKIECWTEFRQLDLIKSIPGSRWDRDSGRWRVPITWSSYLALFNTFHPEFEAGPKLKEWVKDYTENVYSPAMYLRDAFDAPGSDDLFPHQRADVAWMATVRQGLLSNEQGCGKTAAVIRALAELYARGENVFPVLVVCPNSVKYSWKREIERWWPGTTVSVIDGSAVQRRKQMKDPVHFMIINYEALRSHSRLAPYGSISLRRCVECGGEDPRVKVTSCEVHKRELNEITFSTVISDESHRIKSADAKQTRALKYISSKATFRYALSGTPIANDIIDLWSILNFLDPVEWPSKVKWIDRSVDVLTNAFGGIVSSGVKPERAAEFEASVYPRLRRMSKEAVLPNLPEVVEERRDVPMSLKQQKAYDELATNLLTRLDSGEILTAPSMLTATLRLLQLASSYGEIDVVEHTDHDTGEVTIKDKFLLTDPSSKIDAFMEDLNDYKGRNIIVFAVSRQLIMLLSKRLAAHKSGTRADPIPHGLIVGGQHPVDRQAAIDEFQRGETNLILATVGAGGTGITLTAADTAVYLQRSWSMVDMKQASARYHRIGSEKHTSILRVDYVSPGTIEESVITALDGKSASLEELVRDRELLEKAMNGVNISH